MCPPSAEWLKRIDECSAEIIVVLEKHGMTSNDRCAVRNKVEGYFTLNDLAKQATRRKNAE